MRQFLVNAVFFKKITFPTVHLGIGQENFFCDLYINTFYGNDIRYDIAVFVFDTFIILVLLLIFQ